MKKTLFLLLLAFSLTSYSKENIDSLKNELVRTRIDSTKVDVLSALSKAYRSKDPDSALYYAHVAAFIGERHFPSTSTNKAYVHLGIAMEISQKFDSSEYILKKAVEFCNRINDHQNLASAYNSLGVVSNKMGKDEQAIASYIQALKEHELNKNEKGMALAYNNLGVMYKKRKQFDKAIEQYKEAWKLYEKNNEKNTLVLVNIAGVYFMKNDINNAIHYLLVAKEIDEKNNNIESIGRILNNLTNCYMVLNDVENSIRINDEAIQFAEKYNNYEQLILAYDDKATILRGTGKEAEGIAYILKAIEIATKINQAPKIAELCWHASKAYNATKQFELSAKYAIRYAEMKDSLQSIENKQQIAEMQAKYETSEKDKELLKKDSELLKEQAFSKEKSAQRNIFLVALILMIILAFFIFKNYKEKKRANEAISHQKDVIEQKQKEILDSIHYAKKIQRSLLPTERYIERSLDRLNKQNKKD